jgi:putative ABC transport system permease protein
MRLRDLAMEAIAGIAARPSRLLLTTLGTIVGVAALVATIGVGQTAAGQIDDRFDANQATRVVVEPGSRETADGETDRIQLPWDADDRVSRLAGVVAAGVHAEVDVGGATISGLQVHGTQPLDLPVQAASPGLFEAVGATLSSGRFYDDGHEARADDVVILGRYAAERLGLTSTDAQPAVFIGDRAYTVIGILDETTARTELLDAVIMPVGTARETYGLEAPGAVDIRTDLGAAQQVGEQAAVAVAPNTPDLLDLQVPPKPGSMRDAVTGDVNVLFLALGALAMIVGGLGIANVTLLSVMERTGEIGLRRSIGARRAHIAGQFVTESAVIGFLGGLSGAAVGVLATVGVAVWRDWTPLLDPRISFAAPLLGAVIGVLAGAYPAWRASTVEPVEALRVA